MAKLLKFTKSLINFCIHENKATAVFDVNVFKFQEMNIKNEQGAEEDERENGKNSRWTVSVGGELMLCYAVNSKESMRYASKETNYTLSGVRCTHFTH